MKTTKMSVILVVALGLMVCSVKVSEAAPMGTAFTYQGRLIDANSAANGLYDFQFKLFDDPCTGSLIAGPVNEPNLDVIDGYFTAALDFGANVFAGDARWLEIDVRPGDPCEYTILSPRQEITPVPYALQTRGIFVDNSGNVGIGTTSPLYPLEVNRGASYTNIGALIKGGEIPANSWGLLIRAGTNNDDAGLIVQDAFTNNLMRVTGSGNVGIGTSSPNHKLDIAGHINSSQSYKLDGDTVLSKMGTRNILVGEGVGASITIGYDNSAMGHNALYSNTTGFHNSAMGSSALFSNTTGNDNSAMGHNALYSNTTGYRNSAMGSYALYSNTEGRYNSAMGYYALFNNTTGYRNSAMGYSALQYNTAGYGNSAMGNSALGKNTTGFYNSAMGYSALVQNTTGFHNSAMGSYALYYNTEGVYNSAMGNLALYNNTTGLYNSAVGYQAGYNNSTGSGNVFLGYRAGYNETGSNKLYIANGSGDSDVLIYGDFSTDKVGIGTTSPGAKLHINGTSHIKLDNPGAVSSWGIGITNDNKMWLGDWGNFGARIHIVNGNLGIGTANPTEKLTVNGHIYCTMGSTTSGSPVRWYNNRLYYYSSSEKYKKNIQPFEEDFHKILQANPRSFIDKTSRQREIGFIAEEFDKLGLGNLVIYNEAGQPDSLKYELVSLYLLEVMKDQVNSTNQLKAENESLKQRLDALERTIQQLAKGKEFEL